MRYPKQYDDEFLNIVKQLIDLAQQTGLRVQDLVAKGQLTPAQYATLISTVNNTVKKGELTLEDIDKNNFKFDQTFLTDELKQQITGNTPINAVPADNSITKEKYADSSITLEKLHDLTDAINIYPDPLLVDTQQYISSSSNVMNVKNVISNGKNAIQFSNSNPTSSGIVVYGRHIDIPIDKKKYLGGTLYIEINVSNINRAIVSSIDTLFSANCIPYNENGAEISGFRGQTNIGDVTGIKKIDYDPPAGTAFVRVRYDLRVYEGTGPGDSITINRVLVRTPAYNNHSHSVGIVDFMELKKEIQLGVKKKLIHISIDDTIKIFEELEASSYDSIFEHPILNFFRQMNEVYNAKFSLYVYNETDAFNLSNASDKFKNEWQENSDWLKVGFHALKSNSIYSVSQTFLEDYNTTIANLIRICGRKSLDYIPRIHAYAGTLEAVKAWKSTDYGIVGLYTADDNRNSYYINDNQKAFLGNNDELYDDLNSIYFIKTDIRLEHHNTNSKLESALNTKSDGEKLTIFTHEPRLYEQNYLNLIEQCCQFALDNNYDFDFPQNNVNTKYIL